MKANEFIPEDQLTLNAALENWMEMYDTETAAKTILASPEAEPFTKPPSVQKLYRGIVPKDRDINEIKANNSVVAFATSIDGAVAFIESLETMDAWVIIAKDFRPADFLLDFSALYQEYSTEASVDEYEVWMKPTPYYAGVNKNEVVLTSRQYYK